MPEFVIGVDGGGTKTHAVVMDAQGRLLGEGFAASGNPYVAGWDAAWAAVRAAIEEAARQAEVRPEDAAALTLALAGMDQPPSRERIAAAARAAWPHLPLRVENDALAALVGGVGTAYGLVVIAGTGMIAWGVNQDGEQARGGGRGFLLDRGSGYALGLAAVRAALLHADGMGPETALLSTLLRHLGLKQAPDLVPWLYEHPQRVKAVAALAPLVLQAAQQGDFVAVGLVAEAADALAEAAAAVAQRLGLSESAFPLVLTGGVLRHHAFYREAVSQAVLTRLPTAQPRAPRHHAAAGAAWLSCEHAGRPLPPWEPEKTARPADLWASERPNVFSRHLDRRSAREIVGLMHVEDRRAVEAVRPELPVIAQAVEAIVPRMRRGGRLIYVGAGTSGRLGVLDASECPPTFGVAPEQVVGVIAGGDVALRRAVEGAEDSLTDGAQAMAALDVGPDDTVVGLAASGRTPYVRGALQAARARGALTVAVVCNRPAPVADDAEIVIAPLVGPEVLTGSTRLKAGTAQKLVLNMLSTAVMVRLGKVYDNVMVDVQPDNEKLRARARRIVEHICGVSPAEALDALQASQWQVKVAVVSLLSGQPAEQARRALAQAQGQIELALQSLSSRRVHS